MSSSFHALGDVIADEAFPDVDLALRRGRHIGRDDGALYEVLSDGFPFLEDFYARFGCDLCQRPDGYFYLRPTTDRLGRRLLTAGEMLVGQVCALMYLDPASLKGATVKRESVLQRLDGLIGRERLVKVLNPKVRKHFERVGDQIVRNQVTEALRRLADLGMVDFVDDALRLRPALMRFTDPVRNASNMNEALQKLVVGNEVRLDESSGPEAERPGVDENDEGVA